MRGRSCGEASVEAMLHTCTAVHDSVASVEAMLRACHAVEPLNRWSATHFLPK